MIPGLALASTSSKKEHEMGTRSILRNVSLMVVFAAVPIVLFTENVRTVQILGLFTCGAVFGVSLAGLIAAIRGRQKEV
jgi:hypothetical protein